ncbi:hypothetical protein NAT51_15965 [Flavobacterium amniphilum]|uniref:hypothetical protein n=1 Tax=Flavobacterium amniphilum TaxID=1834035 RepID=UPI002029E871|nr:hypothetical protein [Flavobacterium amniphilum]MCL9807031.1 hypothetical protein [Flavobacterium amniphilum]
MKITNLVLLLLAFQFSSAQQKETVTIPKGVVYNYCSPKKIEEAKKLITNNLKGDNYKILQDNLIVGPVLWSRFKNNPEIQKIEKADVTFVVDKMELAGKMSQSMKDSKIIWDQLKKEITGDFVIRKATQQELQYYWAVISFDIEEPLLIVETKEHNYILNLLPKDLKLMWLDEAPRPDMDKKVMYKDGKVITKLDKGEKETKLETVELLNTDQELKENTSLEDLKMILDKVNAIFEELFKNSTKPGKIMVEFKLKKDTNEITYAVKDDLDLDIMKEFEKRVNAEKYPNSKKDPVGFRMLFKVNSYNETE